MFTKELPTSLQFGNKVTWILLIVFLLLFTLRLKSLTRPHFVPGTKIKIKDYLQEEPKIVGQTQRFFLAGVPIQVQRYPEFHYGDQLEIVGSVGDKGLEYPKAQIIGSSTRQDWRGKIYGLQKRFVSIYRRVLPEPQASLLSGIVLGAKSEMPSSFYNDLRKSGTLHIVVASGMNVTLIASTLVSFLLLFFNRRGAVVLALLGIWFYVFLAGAEAPVVRAGIMGSLVFLAQGLGRDADAWRGLGLAAALLLLWNPQNLFELGFQLSFLATGGILFFGTKISRLLKRLPNQIRNDVAQTLSAQIATLPLILWTFGQYSPFSPLANILVVTILPWILRLGALMAIVGLFFLPLAQLLGWLLWPLLTYFVKVVELFGRL